MAHFHHFSIYNQHQYISILVMFRQNTKAIALLFGQHVSFSSLFNLQSTSINFNFGQFYAKYQGYTLTVWSQMAHLHHFSIYNQHQYISILVMFRQNTKAIALLFGQHVSFSSLFNLQSTSINFNFGQFYAKYQGYTLTVWSQMAHLHHFSIYNQHQSISILVILRQITKAIALLFGHSWILFITFQSTININQCQFWSFFGKIPRL